MKFTHFTSISRFWALKPSRVECTGTTKSNYNNHDELLLSISHHHCTECVTYFISTTPPSDNSAKPSVINFSPSHMRKLRPGKVKQLVHSHVGHKWQSKDLNPDLAGLQGRDPATVPSASPTCLQLAQISDSWPKSDKLQRKRLFSLGCIWHFSRVGALLDHTSFQVTPNTEGSWWAQE